MQGEGSGITHHLAEWVTLMGGTGAHDVEPFVGNAQHYFFG